MNHDEIVSKLRERTKTNKAFDVIMHVFGLRERARSILTIDGLAQRMKANNFNFDYKDYVATFQFLAELGLGQLVTNSKGKVIALKGIKVSLQSMGKAACGQNIPLDNFTKRNIYENIIPAAPVSKPEVLQKAEEDQQMSITIQVRDIPIMLKIPSRTSTHDLAVMIDTIRKLNT